MPYRANIALLLHFFIEIKALTGYVSFFISTINIEEQRTIAACLGELPMRAY